MPRRARDEGVLVIGLGRFGASIALTLEKLGTEVLAIDTDEGLVQKYSGQLTHVVRADATQPEVLDQVGAADFSIAVVGVGTTIEASVLIAANLVDLGIPQIWAKAISLSHGKILERIGVNHVIYPEREAGERVAHLLSGSMLDFIQFDDNYVIAKMYPPRSIRGRSLEDSGVRTRYRVTVVGVKTPGQPFTHATQETVVSPHDLIIVSGSADDVERFAAIG